MLALDGAAGGTRWKSGIGGRIEGAFIPDDASSTSASHRLKITSRCATLASSRMLTGPSKLERSHGPDGDIDLHFEPADELASVDFPSRERDGSLRGERSAESALCRAMVANR